MMDFFSSASIIDAITALEQFVEGKTGEPNDRDNTYKDHVTQELVGSVIVAGRSNGDEISAIEMDWVIRICGIAALVNTISKEKK